MQESLVNRHVDGDCFTGLANYRRRFVMGSAELAGAAPLSALGSPTALSCGPRTRRRAPTL